MITSEIAYWRLHNQRISTPAPGNPGDVVKYLVAVQAQDFAGAKWALGLRLPGVIEAQIDRAFWEGSILRTHVLRPTWHFVTQDDIRWLLALTAPRIHGINASIGRTQGLDSNIYKKSDSLLAAALQGGQHLTRNELRDVLEKDGIEVGNGIRLALIMMHAELEGLICSGGQRGRQFTYALLEERAPFPRTLTREEALFELTLRYFTSRGPATAQDFARWSGLTLTDARLGLQSATNLLQETFDGITYWFAEPTSSPDIHPTIAFLLPAYDEYISSYKDYSQIAEPGVTPRQVAFGNALQNIIVVNSQIKGTWRRIIKKDRVTIESNLFSTFSATEKQALTEAARLFGDFLGLPAFIDGSPTAAR
jgi:hypothetical protein